MSATSKQYIESLNSFTFALDQLVKTLVSKESESGSNGDDVMQEFFTSSASHFKVIETIAEDVKSINDNVKMNNSKSDEILKTVKAIKEKKQKGIFDKIEKEDNKQSILEGAKTIVLIAGSIMAIGLAFQVIGKVDFATVIALSVALPLIAFAFAQIADMGDLDYNTVISIGSVLVVMSTSIMLSSHILSMSAKINPELLFTAVAIGFVFTVVAFGASMLLEVLEDSSFTDVLLLGVVMVAISAAIMLSSWILQYTVPIPMWDIITASIAIGIASIVMAITISIIDTVLDFKSAIIGSGMLLVISSAIMLSSWILSVGNYDNYPPIDWALGVGLSVLMLAPAILLLGIPALVPFIIIGSLMLLLVSTSIMTASHILNEGNFDIYPDLDWGLGVGLTMLTFAPMMLLLGGIGIFWPIVQLGADLMKLVAQTIVDISHTLADGNYTDGPSTEWAYGVGYSLTAFMNALSMVQPETMFWWGGGTLTIEDKVNNLKYAVLAMVEIAKYLGEVTGNGVFDPSKAPPKEWAEGVGISITKFMEALNMANDKSMWDSMADFFGGGDSLSDKIQVLYRVIDVMIDIADYLNKKKAVFTGGPSKAWAEGVGGSIVTFAEALSKLAAGNILAALTGQSSQELLMSVAYSMVNIGSIFTSNKNAFKSGPSKDWGESMESVYTSFRNIGSVLNGMGGMFSGGPEDTIAIMKVIARGYVETSKILDKIGNSENNPFLRASKGINSLANAFRNMAGAVQSIGEATNNITDNSLDLIKNISLSVMALSAVDAGNLENVLGKIKPEDIAKLYALSNDSGSRSTKKESGGGFSSWFGGDKTVSKSTNNVEVKKQTQELVSIKQELMKMNNTISKIALNTDDMLDLKSTNTDTKISH